MSMVNKSHSDLLYLLTLLSKKREDLLSPFLDNSINEWIGLSFKYEGNQEAFNLVKERFVTLWIDNHITQIVEDDVPDNVRYKAMELFSEYMETSNSEFDDTNIKHSLLETKLKVIKELLKHEDLNSQKLNEFRYSYEKDKALFERMFRKFDSQLNSNQ